MKDFYKSRTLWIAVIQCIIAVITVLEGHYQIGGVLIIKSVLDIMLRVATTQRLS